MNKKVIIAIGIFVVLAIVLTIITMKVTNDNSTTENIAENILKDSLEHKLSLDNGRNEKILVVYFSIGGETQDIGNVKIGNTAIMASYIVEYLNADSYQIEPQRPYSNKLSEVYERSLKEKENEELVEIKGTIDLSEYDTIFLGYPIWNGDMPRVIYTFINAYDLTLKKIIPFCTHAGSGVSGTFEKINVLTEESRHREGFSLLGKTAREEKGKKETIDWLKMLGY